MRKFQKVYFEVTVLKSIILTHKCTILISYKIVVLFNMTSADFVLTSADVVFISTTILKEMRIAQLSSKNERTLEKIGRFKGNV